MHRWVPTDLLHPRTPIEDHEAEGSYGGRLEVAGRKARCAAGRDGATASPPVVERPMVLASSAASGVAEAAFHLETCLDLVRFLLDSSTRPKLRVFLGEDRGGS